MATTYYHVTTAGVDTKTGADWAHAMDLAAFIAWIDSASFATDSVYYFKPGTYTLTASIDISDRDGTAILPVSIIGVAEATTNEGVNVVSSDWVTGASRPVFACGASYVFNIGDYYRVFNCSFTGASTYVVQGGTNTLFYNCKAENSSGTAGRTAFSGSSLILISCEGISTNGTAAGGAKTLFSYFHDSAIGYNPGAANVVIAFCIFDTCSTSGIEIVSDDTPFCFGNTIYNCGVGVNASDSFAGVYINNIVDTVTDGFLWTTATNSNFFAYNHVGNSVTDMYDLVEETIAAYKDNWVTGGAGDDPEFTDEANMNFSLGATSPCIDAGMKMELGVG